MGRGGVSSEFDPSPKFILELSTKIVKIRKLTVIKIQNFTLAYLYCYILLDVKKK